MLNRDMAESFGRAIASGRTAAEALALHGLHRRHADGAQRFYVYCLVDPRDDSIFYVGKGTRRRALQHDLDELRGGGDNRFKALRLREIRRAGHQVEALVLAEGLDEPEALLIERLIIVPALGRLTNISPGQIGALERLHASLRWSQSVLNGVSINCPPDNIGGEEWADCVDTARRLSETCTRLLATPIEPAEAERQMRENREAMALAKQEVARLMAAVDAGLTDPV